MPLKEFDKYDDPEVRAWALIWKVTEELQGHIETGPEAKEVIDCIIELQKSGKLTEFQKRVLVGMGANATLDSFDKF